MGLTKKKKFANGVVYAMQTIDGYPVETTDTFLPYYTKDAINEKTNALNIYNLGSRKERWMIGVSCMSGCPVRCKFCATGSLKKWRCLTADEIVEQVQFILDNNGLYSAYEAKEFKINYTRMGEPFLMIDEIKKAIELIEQIRPNTHHYISTIGIQGSDYSWIKDNITLQISLHAMNDIRRNWLIPYNKKMSIRELGKIRTNSNQKTTVNLTLVNESDFDINILKEYFDPEYFFIKLSPVNTNHISDKNLIGEGFIKAKNLI